MATAVCVTFGLFALLTLAGAGLLTRRCTARVADLNRRLERERRAAAEALLAGERIFQATFENAPIGIAMSTCEGGRVSRFIRVNAAFARLLGLPADQLAGRAVEEFIHPEDRLPSVEPAPDPDGVLRTEQRYLHATGRVTWAEISSCVVEDPHGDYVVIQAEDIGTRKDSERALLGALRQQENAAHRLRELDTLRTDMVANISHELRTPLASIKGYVEILGDGDVGELTAPQAELVETVAQSTERLTELVDDLLALAQLDAAGPQQPTQGQPLVDVAELVRAAILVVHERTTAKRQQVRVEAYDGAMVHGDFRLLERAVVNLLVNASKFSGEDSLITVSARRSPTGVEIEVRDPGIGIPAQEQPRLFDRFYRASGARELAVSGSGLGLALVKSVAERHGGRVAVSSVPGRGATFTLALPEIPAPAAPAAPAAPLKETPWHAF